MHKSTCKNKVFTIKDQEDTILIRQPKITELDSLYWILLQNLNKINQPIINSSNQILVRAKRYNTS